MFVCCFYFKNENFFTRNREAIEDMFFSFFEIFFFFSNFSFFSLFYYSLIVLNCLFLHFFNFLQTTPASGAPTCAQRTAPGFQGFLVARSARVPKPGCPSYIMRSMLCFLCCAIHTMLSMLCYLSCAILLSTLCYLRHTIYAVYHCYAAVAMLSFPCYLCSAIFAMLSLLCYLCYVVFAMRSSL